MFKSSFFYLLLACLVISLPAAQCSRAFAEDEEAKTEADKEKDDKADEKKSDAKEAEKKKEDKKKELKLDGVLEAEQMTEIILRPEVWSSLKVEEAVAHGTRVKKDDQLLKLETKDIDRKIEDTRRSQYEAKLALTLAEQELEFARETFPLDRKSTTRAKEIAQQDLKYFLEVTLPESKESAERSLQTAAHRLEYVQEELDQLEKMYKEDDLTEETEEIILKRSKRDVEDSEYFLDRAKIRTEKSLNVDLPRQEEQLKLTTEKQLLETEKTLASQEINMQRKQHDFEQQQITFNRSEEQLQELLRDRNLMQVKAPAGGIVYYGQNTRGQWSQVATFEKALRPGGAVTANQVIMTIVDPSEMFLRVSVEEKNLQQVAEGTKGTVTPTAFPDLKIPAEVVEVSLVPISPGKFDCKVKLNMQDRPDRLLPGMGCEFVIELPKDSETDGKDE